MSQSSSVFWAAFGGAAAAGIFTLIAVLAAEWFRGFSDRPLVKVSVSLGSIYERPDISPKTQYIFMDAANPHSKPVTLSTFGIDFKGKNGERLVIIAVQDVDFPYQLDGGKSISTWIATQRLLYDLQKLGRRPSDIKYAFFKSSTGKVYHGKLRPGTVKALEKAYMELEGQ